MQMVSQDTEMTKEELTQHLLFWVLSHVLVFIALPLCAASFGTGIPSLHALGGEKGIFSFKLSVSSVTVSISGLTPLCFFHEGLAFTLSLIMLLYDNRIKRRTTESCPAGAFYAYPNKQLVLGIVLELACPQSNPSYTILLWKFYHRAACPWQPSPAQQHSAVRGSLCTMVQVELKSLQSRQNIEKCDRFCLHFHL